MEIQVKTIGDLHHEVNMSRTKRLAEIRHRIDNANQVKDIDAYLYANELGFRSSNIIQEIRKHKLIEKDIAEEKAIIDYKIKYPNHRFIHKNDLISIVNKYGLIMTDDLSRFTGEFPLKNIKEMMNFKLKDEDFSLLNVNTSRMHNMITTTLDIIDENPIGFLNAKKMCINNESYITRLVFELNTSTVYYSKIFGEYTSNGGNFNISVLYDIDKNKCTFNETSFLKYMSTNYNSLSIVGTRDQFRLNDNEKIIEGQIYSIPDNDPIVLTRVAYGYLIRTMWGDEAQLPEIVDIRSN